MTALEEKQGTALRLDRTEPAEVERPEFRKPSESDKAPRSQPTGRKDGEGQKVEQQGSGTSALPQLCEPKPSFEKPEGAKG